MSKADDALLAYEKLADTVINLQRHIERTELDSHSLNNRIFNLEQRAPKATTQEIAVNTPIIRPERIMNEAMYWDTLVSITSQAAITTKILMKAVSTMNHTLNELLEEQAGVKHLLA